MTYETYRIIFIAGAVACGVMLAVSVLLFFLLRVPHLIGDLSGSTARKAIRGIREKNAATGDKVFKSSPVNAARGRVTDRMTPSGRIIQRSPTPYGPGAVTTKISTQELLQEHAAVAAAPSAVPAEPAGETTLLAENQVPEAGATTVLAANQLPPAIAVEFDITFVHTQERI